ncbi:MAG TPA: TlpA disulfide reductase family protein [Gammaproteobacteria bacterium]|jgi:thiol-disulfide isomerase/thioredoxin
MQAPRSLPIILLLLVAAGAAGFGVYQWLAPTTGPTPANGTPVAQAVTAPVPMSPQEALNAKFDGLSDSSSHTLNDWHGKVVLVNFWATWCAPCREEIPLLVRLQAQYSASGLQVVGIATDETSTKDVKDYLSKMVVNYPMLMGDEKVDRMVAGFGGNLIGLPFSLLLDRNGHVIKLTAGELDPKDADAMVRAALAGLPVSASPAATEPTPGTTAK